MILGNTCMMGFCNVILKDECIPILVGLGHNSRLSNIVSVVEPSDVPPVDVEFCLPSHGDLSPDHDISTSIAVMRDWRLVAVPSLTANPLLPMKKMKTL